MLIFFFSPQGVYSLVGMADIKQLEYSVVSAIITDVG